MIIIWWFIIGVIAGTCGLGLFWGGKTKQKRSDAVCLLSAVADNMERFLQSATDKFLEDAKTAQRRLEDLNPPRWVWIPTAADIVNFPETRRKLSRAIAAIDQVAEQASGRTIESLCSKTDAALIEREVFREQIVRLPQRIKAATDKYLCERHESLHWLGALPPLLYSLAETLSRMEASARKTEYGGLITAISDRLADIRKDLSQDPGTHPEWDEIYSSLEELNSRYRAVRQSVQGLYTDTSDLALTPPPPEPDDEAKDLAAAS